MNNKEVLKYRPTEVLQFIRENLNLKNYDIGIRVISSLTGGNKDSKKYIYIINHKFCKNFYIGYESYFGESIILYYDNIQNGISSSYKFALNDSTILSLTNKDKEELLEIIDEIKKEIGEQERQDKIRYRNIRLERIKKFFKKIKNKIIF